jgi:hypothetical protein
MAAFVIQFSILILLQAHIPVRLDAFHEAGRSFKGDGSFRRRAGAQQGQQEVTQELGGNDLRHNSSSYIHASLREKNNRGAYSRFPIAVV